VAGHRRLLFLTTCSDVIKPYVMILVARSPLVNCVSDLGSLG